MLAVFGSWSRGAWSRDFLVGARAGAYKPLLEDPELTDWSCKQLLITRNIHPTIHVVIILGHNGTILMVSKAVIRMTLIKAIMSKAYLTQKIWFYPIMVQLRTTTFVKKQI